MFSGSDVRDGFGNAERLNPVSFVTCGVSSGGSNVGDAFGNEPQKNVQSKSMPECLFHIAHK